MRRDRLAEIKEAEEINATRRAEAAAKNKVKHSGRPRVAHLVRVPRPLGPLTMGRIHNTLSGALKSAVRAGLIPRNPAPDAELPKVVVPRAKVWTADQLGAFLDAIEGQPLYPLYHLAAFAGMRRGELCGISWDDVDLDTGRITVRWQITEQNYRKARAAEKQGRHGEYRSKPKTRADEDRGRRPRRHLHQGAPHMAEEAGRGAAAVGERVGRPGRRRRHAVPPRLHPRERRAARPGQDLRHLRPTGPRRRPDPRQAARPAPPQHLTAARSRRLRDRHRDAGRPHLSGPDPVDLRTPHRHGRPARRRGHRCPRTAPAQGRTPGQGRTEADGRADDAAEPNPSRQAWENRTHAPSSTNAPPGQLEIHK
jgi:integrase